ncbi:hypothetical protein KC321_g13131, partial [Hortaea werneckii]
HWAEGGKGAVDLARGVISAADKADTNAFKLLYDTPASSSWASKEKSGEKPKSCAKEPVP